MRNLIQHPGFRLEHLGNVTAWEVEISGVSDKVRNTGLNIKGDPNGELKRQYWTSRKLEVGIYSDSVFFSVYCVGQGFFPPLVK
jgi:hypothetical protein